MKSLYFVILLVFSASALDLEQLEGFRKLLADLQDGVIATCNIAFFSELVTFDVAEEKCRNFESGLGHNRGNLATVNSDDKNRDITLLLNMSYPLHTVEHLNTFHEKRWAWLGLRKVRDNGYNGEVDEDFHREDWEWADGETIEDYARFMRKQPDQKPLDFGDKGCDEDPRCYQNQVRVNHEGYWDDTFKFKKHPYACDYKGKYIISASRVSWTEAKKRCQDAGLQLATIKSDEDMKELKHAAMHFLGNFNRAIGVYNNMNWYWVGGSDAMVEGEWKWDATGEEIDSSVISWLKRQPDNKKENDERQNYLSISLNGRADDTFEYKERAFACECPGN